VKFSTLDFFTVHRSHQGSSNLSLEGQSAAEFSSNPNQTHLKKIINAFKIPRKLQAGVRLGLELNSAGIGQI